jgi:predicted dehydrogenase
MDPLAPDLGVGMVGYAFMGAAHSQAWRTAPHFFDLPLQPRMRALCGRDGERAAAAADRFGWESVETDWTRLLAREDIDLVDICSPGDTHAEIAVAALEAGKHVLCEKPLANTVAEAEAMAEAAERAAEHGVLSMVGFTYRRVPAIALARRLVEEGRIGEIRHVRAQYLQDWLTDPATPMSWRLEKDKAGSGALGDIGAHVIDMARYLVGDVATVSGAATTFVRDRPGGAVTVDDAVAAAVTFESGALGSIEATRFATGRKNAFTWEINGSKGSLAFDLERLNELYVSEGAGGFKTVLVTEPSHPFLRWWWPPGHIVGWEHTFVHETAHLLEAIANDAPVAPHGATFEDGYRAAEVCDAIVRSAESGRREAVVYR